MKKLQQTLIIGALLLSPLAITQSASAQQEGESCPSGYIIQTGSDSKNICVSETKYKCTVTNNNSITILNENDQEAFSGEVDLVGSTGSGNSQSGNANNVNGGNFEITINNPGVVEAETCAVVATTTPTAPEKPAPQPKPVPAPVVKPAPKLATTASSNATVIVAGILVATTATLASLKVVSWLRRR